VYSSERAWLTIALLSATAGAVDVIGFLGVGGLFVAHITGNIVILAAHYVTGAFSEIGPLLSVPVFVSVLALVTGLFGGKEPRATLRILLILHLVLLSGFLTLGVAFGPFADLDSAIAVLCGMLGVAAMATQSAIVKLVLPGSPATAVLTTNTVQLTIDVTTLVLRHVPPDDLTRARRRARLIFPAVGGFVGGCTAGAFLELHYGLWSLVLPVSTAAFVLLLSELRIGR
jgi:uncharacterized membrane protein YoaK (UPF0700 family)